MPNENDRYLVSRAGKQAGPFTWAECEQMVRDGRLTPLDFAWREGLTTWHPLNELMYPAGPMQPVVNGQVTGIATPDQTHGPDESIGVVLGQMGCGCLLWIGLLILAVGGGVVFPFLLLLLPIAFIGGVIDMVRKIGRLARRKPSG